MQKPLFPDVLSDGQVAAEVRSLVAKGKVRWTDHAEEMLEERRYSKDEAKECLRKGQFVEAPHVPNRPGKIQYAFAMASNVDGRSIKVVAALVPSERVVVISVIDPRHRGSK